MFAHFIKLCSTNDSILMYFLHFEGIATVKIHGKRCIIMKTFSQKKQRNQFRKLKKNNIWKNIWFLKNWTRLRKKISLIFMATGQSRQKIIIITKDVISFSLKKSNLSFYLHDPLLCYFIFIGLKHALSFYAINFRSTLLTKFKML